MTHDDTGPRTSEAVRRALDVASEGVLIPDGLAETTWLRGRRVRRRRAGLVSGAAAAVLTTTVLGWAMVGGAPGPRDAIPAGTTAPTSQASPTGDTTGTPTSPPTGDTVGTPTPDAPEVTPTLTEEAPEPPQTAPDVIPVDASAETERVWQVLRRSCLESRGYRVWVTGSSLSASQSGARAGDYSRDTSLCDAELAMRLPPVDVQPGVDGQLPEAARTALTEIYRDYVAAAACVERQGMPVDEAPSETEFVDLFAREWMPSWHPWTAAADAGRYAEVRSACPVGG